MSAVGSAPTVGPLLRAWRQRRHLSQLELANAAGVTTRHLSFVETGRARPSREMVLHLAEQLDVPLRDRNQLLIAAGFAPTFRQSELTDPGFDTVRLALDQVLAGHEPYPAVIVDRQWQLVSSNAAAAVLVEGVSDALLTPPVNVLRVALHPDGLAPRIGNLASWSDHILSRLRRQALVTGDEDLVALEQELEDLVRSAGVDPAPRTDEGPSLVAMPVVLESRLGTLALVTTIATFGTALDITLSELALEAFLPADASSVAILRAYAEERSSQSR